MKGLMTLLVTILLIFVIGVGTLGIKYDNRVHERAVTDAKRVSAVSIGGETNVSRVIPGVYKVTHRFGKVETMLRGYSEDVTGYYSFIDDVMSDINK